MSFYELTLLILDLLLVQLLLLTMLLIHFSVSMLLPIRVSLSPLLVIELVFIVEIILAISYTPANLIRIRIFITLILMQSCNAQFLLLLLLRLLSQCLILEKACLLLRFSTPSNLFRAILSTKSYGSTNVWVTLVVELCPKPFGSARG